MTGIFQAPQRRLRHLFSVRSNGSHEASGRLSIPDDVILEVVQHIPSLGPILGLSVMSRHMRQLLLPTIYSSVDLRSNEQCRITLSFLVRNPSIARHVKRLIVRPNHRDWVILASDDEIDESWVVHLIEQSASAGDFPQLQTFMWEGMEIPTDSLWLTLRTSCPNLRNVGCTLGERSLSPKSHLFEFSDLAGFSLTIHKCNYKSHTYHRQPRVTESLPSQLWEMLLTRCPNLRELTINGAHAVGSSWNIDPVVVGRWKRLRSLSLDMNIMERHELEPFGPEHPYTSFLTAHPTLRELFVGPQGLPSLIRLQLPTTALPHIRSFTGSWPCHLYKHPCPSFSSLRHLSLYLNYQVFSISPHWRDTMWNRLKNLTCLTSLHISLEYRERDDDNYAERFHALLASCRNLKHLEISVLPHVVIADFSFSLRDSPQLRSFTLTTVQKLTDEELIKSAMRVARQNYGLRKFVLRYARAWKWPEEYMFKQIGRYEVVSDTSGMPVRLIVHETGYRRGHRYDRRYRQELLRGGDPDKKQFLRRLRQN